MVLTLHPEQRLHVCNSGVCKANAVQPIDHQYCIDIFKEVNAGLREKNNIHHHKKFGKDAHVAYKHEAIHILIVVGLFERLIEARWDRPDRMF